MPRIMLLSTQADKSLRFGPDLEMRVDDPPRVGEFLQVVDVPGDEIECPVPVVLKRGQREMGRIGTCVPMGGETRAVEFEHPLRIAQMLPGSRHPRFVPCGRSRPCTDTGLCRYPRTCRNYIPFRHPPRCPFCKCALYFGERCGNASKYSARPSRRRLRAGWLLPPACRFSPGS